MKLILVESPTKATTIQKFLGNDYQVVASYGHIRDLPKSKLGIDVKHGFAPTYVIPPKAKDVVAHLSEEAKKASEVILATDEDREGEAISWHLVQALGLGDLKPSAKGGSASGGKTHNLKPVQRIVFHEITKDAIEEALKNPRAIDLHLVDAQQARRILDRLVGYELSPFLWRKVRYGLSAGRVQSVAVRLVVEREREIQNFKRQEYWSIEATFAKKGEKQAFSAKLSAHKGKSVGKMDIGSRKEADAILKDLEGAKYQVAAVTVKETRRTPAPPFTTSTLQQEAARQLGFSAKQTMVIAQRLYELGHITYMRTDSTNLAASALAAAKKVITAEFGKEYALDTPRVYAAKSKGAQEAHEAIRPTNLGRMPQALSVVDRGQKRLYELIWKRTIASQMAMALLEQTAVDIEATSSQQLATSSQSMFRATGQVVKFDGFIRVYTEGRDENNNDDEGENRLPRLREHDPLNLKSLEPFQHFTEPTPRYTDATLVKALEAHGIGRPSTYAPTLSTIQDRGYVEKIEKKYSPTEIGIIVNDILVEHFPEIVDIGFTSHVEEELDKIAEGELKWREVCREFYAPFKKHLIEKEEEVQKHVEVTKTPCPHCGKPMIMKFGRMGKFLACPEPGSKVTLPTPEEAAQKEALAEKTKDERCPLCGKPMEVKRGRFGYFLGCADYPKCKGISKIWEKTGFKCPLCLENPVRREKPGDIVLKKSRGRGKPFYACTRYPDCTFVMNKKPESEAELEEALEIWKKKGESKAVEAKSRSDSQSESGTGKKQSEPKSGEGVKKKSSRKKKQEEKNAAEPISAA